MVQARFQHRRRGGAQAPGGRGGGSGSAPGAGAPRRPPAAHLLWVALPLGGVGGIAAVEQFGTWPGAFIGGGIAGAVASAMAHHQRRRRKEAALRDGDAPGRGRRR